MDFKHFLQKENPVIIEIGANNGGDTINYFKEFDNPIVHCFEPDIELYAELLKNTSLLNNGKLYLNNLAVSNVDSKNEIFFTATNKLSGSLKKPVLHTSFYPEVKFEHKYNVETIRLSTYVDKHKIKFCDLLYMDSQGAEDYIIEGGINFIKSSVRYLYTEFSKVELYENALGKDDILKLIPEYEIIGFYNMQYASFGDMLLKNKNL